MPRSIKSTPYASWVCPKCEGHKYTWDKGRAQFETFIPVHNWVGNKVRDSAYIWEATGRCHGCCEVYEGTCKVLGHLLYKLGVKVS